MKYELLLRPFEQGKEFERESVLESLSNTGFEISEDKRIHAEFALGAGRLEVREFVRQDAESKDDESVAGINLEFSLSISRADADMAVSKAFELAQKLGAVVFDPQAGKEVSYSEHHLVLETWQRSVGFQADVVGSVVMGGAAPELLAYGDKPKSRLGLYILGIVVLLAVVYLARRCSGAGDEGTKSYVNNFTMNSGGR